MESWKTSASKLKTKVVLNDIPAVLVAAGLLFSPFLVDYATLPYGYVVPKAHGWTILSGIIVIVSLLLLFKSTVRERVKVSHQQIYFTTLIINLILISSLLSPQPVTSLLGSEIRSEGAIFFVGAFLAMVLANIVSGGERLLRFVSLAVIFSNLGQLAIVFSQVHEQLSVDLSAGLNNVFLVGSFGQVNFLAGRFLLAIPLSFYLLRRKSYAVRVVGSVGLLSSLIGLYLTQSVWALLLAGIAVVLLMAWWFGGMYYLSRTMVGLGVLSPIVLLAGLNLIRTTFTEYAFRFSIWDKVWSSAIVEPVAASQWQLLLLGSGFDSLRLSAGTPGLFIDRSHNLVLDMLAFMGILGLLLVIGIVIVLVRQFLKHQAHEVVVVTFLAALMMILRGLVHTSSAVNQVDLILVVVICAMYLPRVGKQGD